MTVIIDAMDFVHRLDETTMSPQQFEEVKADLREEIQAIMGDVMTHENCC